MKELVEVIAKSLVDHPEDVRVEEKQQDRQVTLELRVDEDDMGKVIGRQGRIAKAMRTVVKAAATRENKKVSVDII
ncbi:MAG: KH domain-containing protein [Mitsuokella jalaludinii]|uniref:KH domain-containing protein n=2 Tax=Selenomonadaceae TaxID=1843491 RepID=UPI001D01B51C|nr:MULTISPECIES: KH domain-containing protein [Mitsuokella]MCB5725721.1 KH domain-containing protein [Mitsuokella jalaludinii]MCI6607226.1 KH domain-containing protein [Mitsuokella jalaludinii]MCI6611940.1 KH domain-containing protein [Mitsuokella jalaludinii]MCI7064206.1 KH domain-containing protein [Mitsuokella jalaludinii]MCI7185086.1 KH domain-containing protein [Mitsuokella jalaludinii]